MFWVKRSIRGWNGSGFGWAEFDPVITTPSDTVKITTVTVGKNPQSDPQNRLSFRFHVPGSIRETIGCWNSAIQDLFSTT